MRDHFSRKWINPFKEFYWIFSHFLYNFTQFLQKKFQVRKFESFSILVLIKYNLSFLGINAWREVRHNFNDRLVSIPPLTSPSGQPVRKPTCEWRRPKLSSFVLAVTRTRPWWGPPLSFGAAADAPTHPPLFLLASLGVAASTLSDHRRLPFYLLTLLP